MSDIRAIQAVRIFTRDLEKASRFYGGTLALPRRGSGETYLLFDVAGIDVVIEAVADDDLEGGGLVGRFLAVSFRVDDVDATYRRLSQAGASFVQPPEKQAWGGTLAFVRDPDANVLTLVS